MSTFLEHLREALAPAYELGEELPGAGMSRVFVATDRALGRQVVVKAGGGTMAAADVPAAIDRTASTAIGYLEEMRIAPRRTTRIMMVTPPRSAN